jgi:hypothetical protein
MKKIGINAICMCVTDDGIWFVQGMCPILYFYDIKINEITKAEAIQIGESYGEGLFSQIYNLENKLYLVPNNSKKIVIYSIYNNTFEYIDILDFSYNMYINCYELRGYLYFIPYRAKKMIKLSITDKNDIEYIDMNYNDREDNCINSACRKGNIVYGALWEKNEIVEIDLDTLQVKCIKVNYDYEFSQIEKYRDLFYLYDMKNKKIIVFSEKFDEIVNEKYIGYKICNFKIKKDGSIILDSGETNDVIFINSDFERVKKIEISKYTDFIDVGKYQFNVWDEYKDVMLGIGKNGILYKYYNFNEKIEKQDIKINKKMYNQLNTIIIRNSKVVKERKTYKLASFLKNI